MRLTRFSPPGNNDDMAGNEPLLNLWNDKISGDFTRGETKVQALLTANHAGTRQIYNPVTHPIDDPGEATANILWNGFPKRFLGAPGQPPRFAQAEPQPASGVARPQDEYLEWFVNKNAQGKIVSVHFTCEGYDYWQFLGANHRAKLVALYKQLISPQVQEAELLAPDGSYNILNVWNTQRGVMHLTHPANNLFAEIILASDATVRRKNTGGQEVTSAVPLIRCAQFGGETRNSDPKIGVEVNQLARQGAMITIKDPVGLYIHSMDDSGFKLKNGAIVQGGFHILRGQPGLVLRAEYRLPGNLATQGFTLSDVQIGGVDLKFGGQIAQKITMKIVGTACRLGSVNNQLVPCRGVGLGLVAEDEMGDDEIPTRAVSGEI